MKRNRTLLSYWGDRDASGNSQNSSASCTPFIAPEREDVIHETEDQHNYFDTQSAYDVEAVPHDPGLRVPISSYPSKDQDTIRRKFIALGPCQPLSYNYPQKERGGLRRFSIKWFDKYDSLRKLHPYEQQDTTCLRLDYW
uniref:Uncharacterized protein n=1 Tax=Kalanchoe fedtschenkoi TaxID=63787 RepID=A0A7N0V6B4_KALFE